METKQKRGRPKKPVEEQLSAIFAIRLTPEERAEIEEAATGDKASAWARRVLLKAARKR